MVSEGRLERLQLAFFTMLGLILVPAAYAGDLCFTATSTSPPPPEAPNIQIVAQGFSLPGKGKCKSLTGFEIASFDQAIARPVAGTVCRNAANTKIQAGFLVHPAFINPTPNDGGPEDVEPLFLSMEVALPTLQNGTISFKRYSDFSARYRQGVTIAKCGAKLPIP
jgi:hypothetical protein